VTTNQSYVDGWTVAHFAAGALMGVADCPLWSVAAVAIVWEVVEDRLKTTNPALFPSPALDSKRNALVDVAAMIGGGALTRRGLGW
jgi:hypothetical protein